MIKKIVFPLILLFGIGIGLVLSQSEKATETLIAEPVMAAENTVPPEVLVVQSDVQQDVLAQSPEEMLQSLNAKAVENLKPGWIHIHTEKVFDVDDENIGVFPNGVVLPLHQIEDSWFFLNEEMLVIKMVSLVKSIDGELIQFGVYKDGIVQNSVFDEQNQQEPYLLGSLDWGLTRDLSRADEYGAVVKVNTFVDGEDAGQIEFLLIDEFDTPIKIEGYKNRQTKTESRFSFDSKTGAFLSKEVISYFEDGSMRTFLRLIQKVTQEIPTDEAMAIFNEIK